mmetsp:Transcript_126253/g.247519  ORF Transcript_126253/g.247519 Transcript_126253/m.247519 type:complete len:290 (+) Transcript_126253:75-944(+)
MVLGLLLRSASSSTTSTSVSPALTAAAAPCGVEAKKRGESDDCRVSDAPADTRPPTGLGETQDEEDPDWELVEALPEESTTGPLSVDDYLVVDSTSGDATPCDSSRDLAASTQRLSTSEEEGADKAKSSEKAQESPVVGCSVSSCCEAPPSPMASTNTKAEAGHQEAEREPPRQVEESEQSFRCGGCGTHIFKACEVISANYHAQSSPGYLLSATHNVTISTEVQQAVYTSGDYDIQEVSCQHCAKLLGVTYVNTPDPKFKYKIGKFLVGSDRLTLPDGHVHPLTHDKA